MYIQGHFTPVELVSHLLAHAPDDFIKELAARCNPQPYPPAERKMSAPELLTAAAEQIEERAKLRDKPQGERSMGRTVNAFNLLFDTSMTETQGWQFMQLLKVARASGGAYHRDDFVDNIGYAALGAECAERAYNNIYEANGLTGGPT